MTAAPVVFWDFDGTLAARPTGWGGTMLRALDEGDPSHGVTPERLRPMLRTGFPWHEWDRAHPELSAPGAWWARMEPRLAEVFVRVGTAASAAGELARRTHQLYVDPAAFRVDGDAPSALERLQDAGARQWILSNHVPELPAIVEALDLCRWFDGIVTSAALGYEKPHPVAYRMARRRAGNPDRPWMVGDDVVADVLGAERAGFRSVLVRHADDRAPRTAEGLRHAVEWVLGSER